MSGLLVIENISDHVSKITIDRTKALNALNSDILRELNNALAHLNDVQVKPEKQTRVLILAGAGDKAFVAGADILEFDQMSRTQLEEYISLALRVMEKIDNFRCPVIAEVGGYCLGGGLELALSCDFIFADETSKFGFPEVTLGLLPGFGGTRRVLRRLPLSRANKMVMSGDMLDAEDALRIGLIDELTSKDDLSSEVNKFAKELSVKPPLAIQSIKRALSKPASEEYLASIQSETKEFYELFYTEDGIEGRKAFIEKRKPVFIGK